MKGENRTTIEVVLERLNQFMEHNKEYHHQHDMDLRGIEEQLRILNGKVIKNTEHRIAVESTVGFLKWFLGVFGITNIFLIIKVLILS